MKRKRIEAWAIPLGSGDVLLFETEQGALAQLEKGESATHLVEYNPAEAAVVCAAVRWVGHARNPSVVAWNDQVALEQAVARLVRSRNRKGTP